MKGSVNLASVQIGTGNVRNSDELLRIEKSWWVKAKHCNEI